MNLTSPVARAALALALCAGAGGAMLAAVDHLTHERIIEAEDHDKLILVNAILPPDQYDNRVLRDSIKVPPNKLLGTNETTLAYRARRAGAPVATIIESVAPNGYGGKIRILVAILEDGTVSGVRVLAHNETPGWGDYIEAEKSRWIRIFEGSSLAGTHPPDWAVRKDGGRFEFVTRATVSARAVVGAVHHAVLYHAMFRDRLYDTALRSLP